MTIEMTAALNATSGSAQRHVSLVQFTETDSMASVHIHGVVRAAKSELERSTTRSLSTLQKMILCLELPCIFSLPLVGQEINESKSYPEPETPILLPKDAPDFTVLDAEVDSFLGIPQAREIHRATGVGLAVVVVDTGINQYHMSFQGKIIPGRNFSQSGAEDDTTDYDGHGSNVAGIIAGGRTPPYEKMPLGIAPDAMIIPLKVFPGGSFLSINNALKWIIANRDRVLDQHGVLISVVNMSLGTDDNLKSLGDRLPVELAEQRKLIAELRALNVAVTVAAGNHFKKYESPGMGFPAICPETVSVAAVYDTQFGTPGGQAFRVYVDGAAVYCAVPGRLTVFSQRLDEITGSANRTDICAPGFIVTSMGPVPLDGSGIDRSKTRSTQDGTSQAAPVVAGILLLMQQRYRDVMKDGDPGISDAHLRKLLPTVTLLEGCMRDPAYREPPDPPSGGVEVIDSEEDPTALYDNVKSTGKSFVRIQALGALNKLVASVGQGRPDSAMLHVDDLKEVQMMFLKARSVEAQRAVIERVNEIKSGKRR